MKLAVQLSTFHEFLKSDLQNTLSQIAGCGFKNVEVTELYGDSTQQFASALTNAGLNTVSLHAQLHHLRARFTENIGYAELLDAEWLVIPIVQLDEYGSGWERLGNELQQIGQKIGGFGRRLAFHTNQAELRPDKGETGLDHLFAGTQRELDFEFDLAAAIRQKTDPAEWLTKLATNVPLLTLDFTGTEITENHPVYQAWQSVKPVAKTSGVQWVILQYKTGPGDKFQELSRIHDLFLQDGLSD